MARLAVSKLSERLAKGKMPRGILLLGGDLYLRDTGRETIVEAYVPAEARDWGVTRFSLRESSLDAVFRQAQTLPMMCARQVVIVAELESLERLGEKARDAAVEQFEDYFSDPALFTVLVLEAAKLDERMKLFKSLSKYALVVGTDLSKDPAERQATAVGETLRMARDAGAEIDRAAAEELAEMLNGDLALIRAEIEKLATYVGERKRITEADVEGLVVSERTYKVWELADLLATGKSDRALVFLESLIRAGEEPPRIVGALAWMFRVLLHAQERPAVFELVRQWRMNPKSAQSALQKAPGIPRQQLLEGLRALYEADNQLKSGAANDRAVLEFLLARLTAPPSAPRAKMAG